MPDTYTATAYPFIFVFSDATVNPTFALTVIESLNKIASGPIGQQLLDAISNAPVAPAGGATQYKVRIMRPDLQKVQGEIGRPGTEGGSKAVATNELDGRQGGAGSRALCIWNPNIFNTPNGPRPAFIGLAHELIHCYHYTNHIAKATYDDEESFTVGLAPYHNAAITENRIRLEHNVPVRHAY